MKLSKKILCLSTTLIIFLKNNLIVQAFPTPIFDSLTPNLQIIMRLNGEKFLSHYSRCKTPEEVAERELNREHVEIDGNLYKGHGGPMKLTDEDIESLYKLPNVKQLDLKWFNLKEVDFTKLLNINNNKTMQFLDLNNCRFSLSNDEIVSIVNKNGYKVEEGTDFWILWPGVDIYDIIDDGRLKNCH